MSILTQGSLTSEVEAALDLKTAIDPATAVGLRVDLMVKGVEADCKQYCNRNFEQKTYSAERHDIDIDQDTVFLSDWPVTTFTSLEQITSLDDNGDPATTYTPPRKEYVVDLVAGLVLSLNGCFPMSGLFPSGPQSLRLTYVAGYTALQIAGNQTLAGAHDGAANSASLKDSTRNFVMDGVQVGDRVANTTDGSSATVTAIATTTNPNDTLLMTLAGGTQNDWDVADAYTVTLINRLVPDEIRTLKSAMIEELQRRYMLGKESLHHLKSISFGGEIAQLQLDLSPNVERILKGLKRFPGYR